MSLNTWLKEFMPWIDLESSLEPNSFVDAVDLTILKYQGLSDENLKKHNCMLRGMVIMNIGQAGGLSLGRFDSCAICAMYGVKGSLDSCQECQLHRHLVAIGKIEDYENCAGADGYPSGIDDVPEAIRFLEDLNHELKG